MARILLAEDDENLRFFLARALRRAGHEVNDYGDGESALGYMNEHAVDLLLADVVMPGLDGIEVARRATAQVPGLKVLFASGYAGGFGPAAPLLKKPYRPRQLAGEIAAVLGAPKGD